MYEGLVRAIKRMCSVVGKISFYFLWNCSCLLQNSHKNFKVASASFNRVADGEVRWKNCKFPSELEEEITKKHNPLLSARYFLRSTEHSSFKQPRTTVWLNLFWWSYMLRGKRQGQNLILPDHHLKWANINNNLYAQYQALRVSKSRCVLTPKLLFL